MNLRFFYPKNRNCPCGSTRKAKSCCLVSSGKWYKKPSNIVPKSPKTNYSNPKCYLNFSNDCCEKVSKEHYISEYVLNHVKHIDDTIIITGLPWIKRDTFKKLYSATLSAKILCKRHNENLSGIDRQAGDLLRVITKIHNSLTDTNLISEIFVFSGIDIEKWMLKTICNMVASEQIKYPDENIPRPILKDIWLKILYDQEKWPDGWGLYFMNIDNGLVYYNQDFSFQPVYHPTTGEILATKFRFNNFQFNLLLGKPDHSEGWGTFRPATLIFKKNDVAKYVEITWKDNYSDRFIEFNHIGKTDELPPNYPLYPFNIE